MTISPLFSEASILLSIGGFWLLAMGVTTAFVLPLCIAAKRGDEAEEAMRQAEQPGFVFTLLEEAPATRVPARVVETAEEHGAVRGTVEPARTGAA